MRPEGEVFPECPIQTLDNVKVADVVWVSPTLYTHIRQEEVCSIAPEICVEVRSLSNTDAEMLETQNLYLAAGDTEVWICNQVGQISFFDASGFLTTSRLVPDLPAQVSL
jgi:Uma2 family endonuclease